MCSRRILLNVRSKVMLSLLFSLVAAFLSAFLDALTVTAVLISVGVGFYSVYHKVASGKNLTTRHDHAEDDTFTSTTAKTWSSFRAFLRSLLMHGAVGTALGGVCTLVGEPQNLLIATIAGWDFMRIFHAYGASYHAGAGRRPGNLCVLEITGRFGYGARLPDSCAGSVQGLRSGGRK